MWKPVLCLTSFCVAALFPGLVRSEENALRLATTTSTVNSGLMDVLLPAFKSDTDIKVTVIAVGTGKALKLGRDGQVDVVLVNAPEAERQFIDAGHGVVRYEVMHNSFVMVGPRDDPAGVSGSNDVLAALQLINDRESGFVSRGDDSGTHKMELQLWKDLEIEPYGRWYREIGLGMSDTLRKAAEFNSYTLTDRGTWLSMRDKLALTLVVEDVARLANHYGVIAVNPKRHRGLNARNAHVFVEWLLSARTQALIRDYRIRGEPLFIPMAPGQSG